MPPIRIATFNLQNLAPKTEADDPTLDRRVEVMQPQLTRVDADILCLQEVHAQGDPPRELAALDELIAGTQYETFDRVTTRTDDGDPYDKRNLVILSRYDIERRQQVNQDLTPDAPKPAYRPVTATDPAPDAETITWERPILRATVELDDGREVHVLNVHLKSKIPTDIEGQKLGEYTWKSIRGWAEGSFISSIKRVGQALELRQLIDTIFEHNEAPMIAACGDFNAEFGSVPIEAIVGPRAAVSNPDLSSEMMVPCGQSIPEDARYTLLHLGEGLMLDHILISRPLLEYYEDAEIHNEILGDESGAFRSDKEFPESDHAPMIARFEIPGR